MSVRVGEEPWVRVLLLGRVDLYVERATLEGKQGGPLAPPSHVDDDGFLIAPECFRSDTFGEVRPDGTIARYGYDLGTIKDLVEHQR